MAIMTTIHTASAWPSAYLPLGPFRVRRRPAAGITLAKYSAACCACSKLVVWAPNSKSMVLGPKSGYSYPCIKDTFNQARYVIGDRLNSFSMLEIGIMILILPSYKTDLCGWQTFDFCLVHL